MIIKGRYALGERRGEGGMATVYRAVDQATQRTVAVKTLRRDLSNDRKYVEMLFEEARIGADLHSPHIVRLLDSGSEGGLHYLVLEWVDGLTVRDWLYAHGRVRRTTSWLLVSGIVSDALAGLAAAHGRVKHGKPAPVIHRDISPENILLAACGRVKLADFGVARARDRDGHSTGPGMVKGKLSYLAPEITAGQASSVQSDLYSMGVVLWESLAGKKMHDGDQAEIFRQVSRGEVRPLAEQRPDVPAEILSVVERALRPDKHDRYASAQEMRLDLTAATRVMPSVSLQLGPPFDELAASVREARHGFQA